MASPIGHSLAGITCALVGARKRGASVSRRWLLFGIVAGNAADLDFLPGLAVADINRFHHGATHSLSAMLLFGVISCLASRWLHTTPATAAATGMLAYGSHLLLDLLADDSRPPFGIPLFWPITDEHWISPYPLFSGVRHGTPGDSLHVFLTQLFSWENLSALGVEILILAPLLVITAIITRPPHRKATKTWPEK